MSDQDEKDVEQETVAEGLSSEQPEVEAHKKKLADEPRDEDDADFEAHKKK